MVESEDVVLARELGKLGGVGARWVARFLPLNVAEATASTAAAPAVVAATLPRVFGAGLEVVSPVSEGDIAGPTFRLLTGAGRLNLNPALVTIRLQPDPAGTRVFVRGVAKEGLVKQRAGEEAARRAVAALADALALSDVEWSSGAGAV